MKCPEPLALSQRTAARPRRRLRGHAWLSWLALLPLAAAAATAPPPPDHFRYRLWGGFEFSDNWRRAQTYPQDDLRLVPMLDFALQRSADRWRLRGDGELRLERSLRGRADRRLQGRFGLAMDWALLPQRLYWTFQDTADVAGIDALAADGPDNRQQTNIFLTGPVLLLGNPDGWAARLEARAARASAEESRDFNHDRFALAASLQRRSDAVRSWSLDVEHGEVRFDHGAGLSDYRRQDLVLRYAHALPRLGLDLSLGHSRIARERGADLSQPLLRAVLRWSASDSGSLRLDYVDELSDSGRDLALAVDAQDRLQRETRRALLGADLHRVRGLAAEWTQRGVRSEWTLGGFARDYDYLGSPGLLERQARGLRLAGFLRLTPLLVLHLGAGAAEYRFDAPQRRDRDTRFSLSAERRLDPRWSLRLGVGRYLRSSDLAGASHRENVLSVFLVYASGG